MPKGPKRVYRTGKLFSEQAARDRAVRRKVVQEFPPLEAAPDAPVLSEPLREAIANSGKSPAGLAKQASPKSCCGSSSTANAI